MQALVSEIASQEGVQLEASSALALARYARLHGVVDVAELVNKHRTFSTRPDKREELINRLRILANVQLRAGTKDAASQVDSLKQRIENACGIVALACIYPGYFGPQSPTKSP
jgi:hypothetical protein